jgi:hypothetical protein
MVKSSARSRVARWVRLVVAVLALTGMAGCAVAPSPGPARTMQPGDFKMLAGTWDGSETTHAVAPPDPSAGMSYRPSTQPVQGVIQESGAFFTELRGVSGAQRPGPMKVGDGGVVTYETATSKGMMTFHESQDGKSWVWKWDGRAADGGAVRSELTKPK